MDRWRHLVVWADYAVMFRGTDRARAYRLTPERRRRLEALLGDAIALALDDQSWLWSWNDWNWHGIGGQ